MMDMCIYLQNDKKKSITFRIDSTQKIDSINEKNLININ